MGAGPFMGRTRKSSRVIPGFLAFHNPFKGLSRGAAQGANLRSAGGTLVDECWLPEDKADPRPRRGAVHPAAGRAREASRKSRMADSETEQFLEDPVRGTSSAVIIGVHGAHR